MTQTVHLHIGEPKTGTTYIQAMLFHHQQQLNEAGLLVPGRNLDHIRGGHDVLGRAKTAGTHETEGAWQALCDETTASSLPHSVISMEMMTRARPRQVARAVQALPADQAVRVIITARELSRLAPARWQESVQFRKSWTLEEYLSGVFAHPREKETGAAKHFWGLHDTPKTVATWANEVGLDNVTVVTLPPSGSSPDQLWLRFGEALGVALDGFSEAEQANASLGSASAEVMRRLNLALVDLDVGEAEHARICRKFLGKTVLPQLRRNEPTVVMPVAFRATSRAVSDELVAELLDSGVRVVGDLSELLPASDTPEPEPATDTQMLDAALAALAALVEQNAQLARKARRRGRDLPFTEVE
jgi:hypothetical protein